MLRLAVAATGLTVVNMISCSDPLDGSASVIGHTFHPREQQGTVTFVDAETGDVTEYPIQNGEDSECWLEEFGTTLRDELSWEGRPEVYCAIEDARSLYLTISAEDGPESIGWPERDRTERGYFSLSVDPKGWVATEAEYIVEIRESVGEVVEVPEGADSDTPDLKLASADYRRVYSIEAEIDCSDDPECGGTWTVDLLVTQTADDVGPLYARDP